MRTFLRLAAVAVLVAAAGLSVGVLAQGNNQPPSDDAIAFAQHASDLMTNTLVAALLQEIGETTPANADEGKLSISLVFNDKNSNMRLVGAFNPLEADNVPQDAFESTALADALSGVPYTNVERVSGKWYYRRSIPLSNFAPQCQTCHANFASLASTDWVGALMLKVPIEGK